MSRGRSLVQQVRRINKSTDRAVKQAVSARTDTGKPLSQKKVVNLKQLKGAAIKAGGKFGLQGSNRPGTSELGDDDDDNIDPRKDDQEIEKEESSLMEQEDEDELSDNSDMSEVLDETSLTGDVDKL